MQVNAQSHWYLRESSLAENAYLEWDGEEVSPLDVLAGHVIAYRIAVGPNRGQKAFTLQTLPAVESEASTTSPVESASGFSLHAGVAAGKVNRCRVSREGALGQGASNGYCAYPRAPSLDASHGPG